MLFRSLTRRSLGPLLEARAHLEPVIAYRGTWLLRVNVRPYAEFRIVREGKEQARDLTPSSLSHLEIASSPTELELFWPSEKDPRRRWKTSLADLKPGETVVVSGDMNSSDFGIERK